MNIAGLISVRRAAALALLAATLFALRRPHRAHAALSGPSPGYDLSDGQPGSLMGRRLRVRLAARSSIDGSA